VFRFQLCFRLRTNKSGMQATEEQLEVWNPDGTTTGRSKSKKQVHKDGDWYGGLSVFHKYIKLIQASSSSHMAIKLKVCIVCFYLHLLSIFHRGELLVQKRSTIKENYPGLWDISCKTSTLFREILIRPSCSCWSHRVWRRPTDWW
jgi:hypothetical protein